MTDRLDNAAEAAMTAAIAAWLIPTDPLKQVFLPDHQGIILSVHDFCEEAEDSSAVSADESSESIGGMKLLGKAVGTHPLFSACTLCSRLCSSACTEHSKLSSLACTTGRTLRRTRRPCGR